MASYNLRTVIKMMGQNILNWVKSNCVNNLLSTSTNLPLAAAQGKVLDEKIGQVTQSLESLAPQQKYFERMYTDNYGNALLFGGNDRKVPIITAAGNYVTFPFVYGKNGDFYIHVEDANGNPIKNASITPWALYIPF